MAEPVIVPVQLEVTDIDTSNMNFKDVQKTISNQMSTIKKSIQDAFSGIDASAINKPIEQAMTSVKKSVQAAEDAQLRYSEALIRAGKSSKEYKSAMSEVDTKIKGTQQVIDELTNMGVDEKQIAPFRKELEELIATRNSINPIDFIDKAAPIELEKVANAYKKVLSAQENVNKQSEKFNQTAQDNKLTDEYNELLKQAETYKKQLEELDAKSKKMEAVGATDKQWESLRYDTEQVSSSLDEVIKKMRESVKTGKAFRFGEGNKSGLSRQINSISMSGGNRAGNINKRAMANESPYTEDYQKSLDELDKFEKKVQAIKEKSAKMMELGASKKQLQSLAYDAEHLTAKIEELRHNLVTTADEGKAFKFGNGDVDGEINNIIDRVSSLTTTLNDVTTNAKEGPNKLANGLNKISSVFSKITSGLNNATDELNVFGDLHPKMSRIAGVAGKITSGLGKVSGVASKASAGLATFVKAHPKLAIITKVAGSVVKVFGAIAKGAVKAGQAIAKGFAGAIKVLGKVGQAVGKVVKGFASVAKGVAGGIKRVLSFGKSGNKASTDMNKGFKKLGKNIMMFGLGFRTAYYMVKRLRNIFIEGFKTMGGSFDEIGKPMAKMMESFNRLKGSIATAFQPLVSVVMPILTQVMNRLSDLLESVGKFGAALTGQGKIYKAVAKDIDSVSDSASGANKQLGSYDKLEVIQQDNGTGYDYEAEEVAVESAASSFANMVKEAWANADFTSVGQFVTDQLLGVLDNIENNVIPKVTGFANRLLASINTFLTGLDATAIGAKVGSIINTIVDGLDFAQLGALFANINNTVWGFLSGLVNSIDWANLGKSVAEGITSIFATLDLNSWVGMISGLVNGITTAISTLISNVDWANVAVTLATALNNLFASIDIAQIGTTISEVMNAIWTFVGTFFATVDFGSIMSSIAEGINNAFSGDPGAFNSANVGIANAFVTMITTAIEEIDWGGILNTLLDNLQSVTQALGDAMANSDNPIIAGFGSIILAINDTITILRPVIEDLIASIWPIIEAILPVISQLLPPLTELIAQAASMILPVLIDSFNVIWPILQDLIDIILPILFDCMESLQPIFDALTSVVLPVISDALTAIMPLVEGLLGLVFDILNPIMALLGPLLEIVFSILDPLIVILTPIIDIIGTLCGLIGGVLRPILDALLPVMDAVSAVFQLLGPIFEVLATPLQWIADLFEFVAGVASAILIPIIEVLATVIKFLMGNVVMLADGFKIAFAAIKDALDWLWSKVKIPLNGIIGFLEGVANGVIKAVNFIIKALNKLSFDIPDWVPGIGGQTWGFNIKEIKEISIPRLAQGAVIPPNKEFLAVLGDQKNGTNIEAPLDTIKQALAEVLAELGGMGNQQPIVLQVNGRTLAQVVWDEQQKRYKQTGKSMA